jgi:hypothetical protein
MIMSKSEIYLIDQNTKAAAHKAAVMLRAVAVVILSEPQTIA